MSASKPCSAKLRNFLKSILFLFVTGMASGGLGSAAEKGVVQIPADRWLEIDLYWFDRDHILDSAEGFWKHYGLLYEGVRGWKGLILSVGLTAGYILDWHGDLDEPISLPKNMRPRPMLKCDRQLTGTTEERISQWKTERLALADRTAWASYQPWTYRDLKKLADALREVARQKYSIEDFRVGSYVTGWEKVYGSDPIEFSRRHPNSYFRVNVNGRVFNHLALLGNANRRYGAFPDGIKAGTPAVEFFGKQWGNLSKALGLDAILLKDCFFQPEAYQRAGPYGWTAPSDPMRVEEWHKATSNLVRTTKLSNPRAIVIGQSSAASAVADWRVQCLDLERLANEGYMDAYLDQTWSGAYAEVGVRNARFWNAPWLGWTHQMANVLMHAAMLADTKVRHYVLTETFDAWEEFDILHNSPERLKWGIWAYLHAAVKTPGGLKMPVGSYISWANRGKSLIPKEDVEFLAREINAATLDARETVDVLGATLVYCRSAMEWQSRNAPGESIKEWIDEQAGTVMKWPVPIFSATRSEWLPKVRSDLFILQTPVHVTKEEEQAILGLMERSHPVVIFASPVGGLSPEIARVAGVRSDVRKPRQLIKRARVAANCALTADIPQEFSILHSMSENIVASEGQVLYEVEGNPALIVNATKGKRLAVWDPAELLPDHPRMDKPFADFIGSPYAYVIVARVLNDFLKDSACPHVKQVEPGQAVNVGYWKLRDGSYRVLAGNLEEGLRHDADFSRQVTLVFPHAWPEGEPLRVSDLWHDGSEEQLSGKEFKLTLAHAESKLLRVTRGE